MLEKNVVVGPFQCNCRILACPETGEAVLVDPGDEAGRILKEIENSRTPAGQPIRVKFLLHTHAHLDHIGATRAVKEAHPQGRIALHQADDFIYRQLQMQGQMFGFQYDEPLPVDHFLNDGEVVEFGKLRLSVLHTPGHSPGGVCLRLHEDSGLGAKESLYSGDTLFKGSIGRTDLWGGDTELLLKSIRDRIFALDDDTRLCPGHGPESSVGLEERENPFFR